MRNILLLSIIVFFLNGVVFAEVPEAPELLVKSRGTHVNITWTPSLNANSFILHYAPFPSATPIQQTGPLFVTNISAEWPKENGIYYIAVTANNEDGSSVFSNIELVAADRLDKSLEQINNYIDPSKRWPNYDFSRFISLGDIEFFECALDWDDFNIRVDPNYLSSGDEAAYVNTLLSPFYYKDIILSKEPESFELISSTIWHEMLHAIHHRTPFFSYDDDLDNHTYIYWMEQQVNTIAINQLKKFEDLVKPYLNKNESEINSIALQARRQWKYFLRDIDPSNFSWEGKQLTDAHVQELLKKINYWVDPDDIRDRYIQSGYPKEFFYETWHWAGEYRILSPYGDRGVNAALTGQTFEDSALIKFVENSETSNLRLDFYYGGNAGWYRGCEPHQISIGDLYNFNIHTNIRGEADIYFIASSISLTRVEGVFNAIVGEMTDITGSWFVDLQEGSFGKCLATDDDSVCREAYGQPIPNCLDLCEACLNDMDSDECLSSGCKWINN